MRRRLLVIVCIAGLLAAIAYGAYYLVQGDEPSELSREVGARVCDLDVKTCHWGTGTSAWSLDLQRSGPAPTDALRLELMAPAGIDDGERMIAVLEGQSMYMGQYPIALQRGAATAGRVRFHAEFQAPLCTIDPDMTWTITLKRGAKSLAPPVRPIFQTRHPDDR